MTRATLALGAAVLVLGAMASCDPVHTDAVDALGGEQAGVHIGPLHRPGQPCLQCHDGALGDPPAFSVAGTIFVNADDITPAVGAGVSLTDSAGSSYTATTNAAGNFYVTPRQFAPAYPMKVAVTYGGTAINMVSRVGWEGSCAKCHSDPAGPTSAGHIFIPSDGVTP